MTVDQIRPIRNQVLVRPDPVPVISAGGIHIPESVNADNPNYYTMTGTVLATGKGSHDGESFHPIAVKVGDRVVFGRYAGKQIEATERWTREEEPHRCEMERKVRVMMLREPEIIGLADSELVQHGYQAPKFTGIINRPGDAA